MALRSYRTEAGNGASVTVDNFMNTTGQAGYLVVHNTATSGAGAAFDDANSVVALASIVNGSGERPAGVLLQNVVNKDLTSTHLNVHNRETQVGGKVALLSRGSVVTNAIAAATNPIPGDAAYFTVGGNFLPLAFASTVSTGIAPSLQVPAAVRVGTFTSSKDLEGYAKIEISII